MRQVATTHKAISKILLTGGGALTNDIRTYQLGTVEITAPEEVDFNPTAVVVSKKDIDNTASLDVAQALRFTPGTFNISTGTGSPAFYIRGFDERDIGFYLDGIPVNDIYTGNAAAATDLFPFFTFGLSEIQVSKGYTSPAFSMGKLGGAINMVTSIPTKDLEFNAKYLFIANNEHRTNLQVGRNLGNKYFQLTFSHIDRKSLNYSYDHSAEGPVEISKNGLGTSRRAYMISGKYGWFIGDNHAYSVNFYHQHEKMRGSQPANFSFPYYDKTGFYVLGDSRFSELLSLNSKLWYTMNLNVGDFYSNSPGSKYDDYSLGLTETLKFDFSQSQNLKVGVMVKNDNHEAIDEGQIRPKREWKILNSSLFTEYAIKANDMFRFVVSGSWDRHDGLNLKTINDDYSAKLKKPNKHLNGWNLQGIAYMNLGNFGLLHANIGHKSQIPKIRYLYEDGGIDPTNPYVFVIGNDSLNPESIINYELGGDFDFKFERVGTLVFGATGFYNDIRDMIYEVSDTNNAQCVALNGDAGPGGGNPCIQYKNATQGYSFGAEAYVKQGFFDDTLTLGANYSFIERRSYDRDTNGNKTRTREFLLHPKHYVNVSALVIPAKEYNIALMGTILPKHKRYVGTTAAYRANTHESVATVVYFDIEANYYLKENLKLSFGAYNLFDKDYIFDGIIEAGITHPRQAAGIPGRRIFGGIEYSY